MQRCRRDRERRARVKEGPAGEPSQRATTPRSPLKRRKESRHPEKRGIPGRETLKRIRRARWVGWFKLVLLLLGKAYRFHSKIHFPPTTAKLSSMETPRRRLICLSEIKKLSLAAKIFGWQTNRTKAPCRGSTHNSSAQSPYSGFTAGVLSLQD